MPVTDESRERNQALGTRQLTRQLGSFGSHDETSTDLHDHISEHTDTAKRIVCECGYIVPGEDDEQVVELGRKHMAANHPAIAAAITAEELLDMAARR